LVVVEHSGYIPLPRRLLESILPSPPLRQLAEEEERHKILQVLLQQPLEALVGVAVPLQAEFLMVPQGMLADLALLKVLLAARHQALRGLVLVVVVPLVLGHTQEGTAAVVQEPHLALAELRSLTHQAVRVLPLVLAQLAQLAAQTLATAVEVLGRVIVALVVQVW
jgi:hypothetical protein